jgi:hypothetical protein
VTPSEQDNLTRWDGVRRGFYEVYFLKLNDRASRTALWVRYTLLIPIDPARPAEASLWGIFFDAADPARNLAVKSTVHLEDPAAAVTLGRHGFRVTLAGAELTHGHANGAIDGAAGPLRWDLHWDPPDEPVRLFPAASWYEGRFPKTKYTSPAFAVRFRGRVESAGRTITLDGAPGQQSHLWGVKHAERWTWAHCNDFDGAPAAAFEGLTARIRLAPGVASPPLTALRFHWGGETFVFNQPLDMVWRNRSRDRLGHWEFMATAQDVRFAGAVTARIEDVVGVGYTDPDGETLVCHNTKVADAHVQVLRRRGGAWAPEAHLVASGTVALETVTREGDPRVPVRV